MEIVHVDFVIEHGAIKGEIVNYRRCARFFFKCLYIIRFYVYYVFFSKPECIFKCSLLQNYIHMYVFTVVLRDLICNQLLKFQLLGFFLIVTQKINVMQPKSALKIEMFWIGYLKTLVSVNHRLKCFKSNIIK